MRPGFDTASGMRDAPYREPTSTPRVGNLEEAVPGDAQAVVVLATIGGLLLATVLAAVAVFDRFRPAVYLAFVFMSAVAPLVTAGLVHLNDRAGFLGARISAVLSIVGRIVLLCSLLGVLVAAMVATRQWLPLGVSVAAMAGVAAWHLSRGVLFERLDGYLVCALAAVAFVFSPLDPEQPIPVGYLRYVLGAPGFYVWALLAVLWTAAGIALFRIERSAPPERKTLLGVVAGVVAAAVVLGFYDDGHLVDMSHYMPYVGPAMHVLRGGTAMVDAYSVYGLLPWLIQSAAFDAFTPSFGTASVVVRIANVIYFDVLLLTLVVVTRRRAGALWFFVPALMVAVTSYTNIPGVTWNINAVPSTLAMRYLVPAIMMLLLAAASGRTWARWAALPLVGVASLWSVETFVFTLAVWACDLLLGAVRARSFRLLVQWLALAVAAVVLAQSVFAAVVYFRTGAVVDFAPYFDMFIRYRPSEESLWSVPFVRYYALWLPIGAAYFLVVAMAAYRALRRDAPDSLAERLLPVAVFGLGPLAYFFGRPQEANMSVPFLPFAITAITVADLVFVRPRRYGAAGVTLAGVLGLGFALTIASGFEHFMRPMDPTSGNSSILRRCLSAEGCRLAEVPRRIRLALETQPLDPRTTVARCRGDGPARIAEAIALLSRFAPGTRYVGMLTDVNQHAMMTDCNTAVAMTAFMATGHWFAWSISSPIIDDAPLIERQVLKRVTATQPGMPVIIANDRSDLQPLNAAILDVLTTRCQLRPVEGGRFFSAFVVEACAQGR